MTADLVCLANFSNKSLPKKQTLFALLERTEKRKKRKKILKLT